MNDFKMSLIDHLVDLKKRIVISISSLFAIFLVAFNYSEELFNIMIFPLKYTMSFSMNSPFVSVIPQEKLPQTVKLVFLAPAEAFWMNMKIAIVASVIVGLPVIFSQIWKFISPGLLQKEKKYVLPFIFIATVLFLIGAAFCFFVVLPFALGFLLTYKVGDILMPMLSVGQYMDFCIKFLLAFGAIFELPILIIFAVRIGLVTPATLAKNRKYAILIAFIVAAILTPTPDAFNQVLMAVPIIVLYEAGILVARIFFRKKVSAKEVDGSK